MNINLDGKSVEFEKGETILEIATRAGVKIPTLCYLKELHPTSSCRICLVELGGSGKLVPACSFVATDGMIIKTNSEKVVAARRMNLELILSNHNYDCERCVRNGLCELQTLVDEYGADEKRFVGEKTASVPDVGDCLVRDNSKCILCKKCVQVCSLVQDTHAIKETSRGFNTSIKTAFDRGIDKSSCVGCGQCIKVCPTGALSENQNIKDLDELLKDEHTVKVVAPAPAARVGIMEAFNLTDPVEAERKLVGLLKKIGFDFVFDINFGADLTVVEESKEFLGRLKSRKNLPMFTSCCPGWVDYAKKFHPEILKNISTCKSPLMMFGAVVKNYWADKTNTYKDNIRVVSVMPCTAKKKEGMGENKDGERDVDLVITVRELLYIINKSEIDISDIAEMEFDDLLGESSGAGVIFGASGGVMEASVRALKNRTDSAYDVINFKPVQSVCGAKYAEVCLDGKKLCVAVVSGLKNTNELIKKINAGELKFDFVEVMACPGGCVNGGGMPLNPKFSIMQLRDGLRGIDKVRKSRLSHKTKAIKDFLEWRDAGGKIELHTSHN